MLLEAVPYEQAGDAPGVFNTSRQVGGPHPQLLRGGWPTAFAIRAQYRFDRWRDVVDNRDT